MHLVDTLQVGGAERVAVNLVNALPRPGFQPFLCTTRYEGPLAKFVRDDVGRLRLNRKRRFELQAVRRLVNFIRRHNVEILHAHGSTVLMANFASRWAPYPRMIWHDHYGIHADRKRPAWLYRLLLKRAGGVLAVNECLARWARERLRMPSDRVWYVPNFVSDETPAAPRVQLPGTPGARIVCVANLRPVKDHGTLLQAMADVVQRFPAAHLLLVGSHEDAPHTKRIVSRIAELCLNSHVTLLGCRDDVGVILEASDLAVLSSSVEGLPMSLLEYGKAGLAVVATDVGQCAEVLDHGRAGRLVPKQQPQQLAEALSTLLESPADRAALGRRFRRRVQATYSATVVVEQIVHAYEAVNAA
jgi:glycosyltransferase involved in cell wall biosynthesis